MPTKKIYKISSLYIQQEILFETILNQPIQPQVPCQEDWKTCNWDNDGEQKKW